MAMPLTSQKAFIQLLGDWSGGDDAALEKLIPLVQPELHRLARYYMSRERAGHKVAALCSSILHTPHAEGTDALTGISTERPGCGGGEPVIR